MNSSLDALELEGNADTNQGRELVSSPSSPLPASSLWGGVGAFDMPLPCMRCPWNDAVHAGASSGTDMSRDLGPRSWQLPVSKALNLDSAFESWVTT